MKDHGFPKFVIENQAPEGHRRDDKTSTDVEEIPDYRPARIEDIPKSVLNCIYDRVLDQCAYTDHECICKRLKWVVYDAGFQACVENTDFNNEQIWAPAALRDFCSSVSISLGEFPAWMTQLGELRRRQGGFSSIYFDPSDTETTTYITSTITAAWGETGYFPQTTTLPYYAGVVSVLVEVENMAAVTTKRVTTTIPATRAGFTSTYTNANAPQVTVLVGKPSGSSSSPSDSTSNDSSSSSSSSSSGRAKKKGLGSGAKIGLGVAIPLVILAIALLLGFLRRRKARKNRKPQQVQETTEKDDGNLPENVTNLQQIDEITPKPPPPAYLANPSRVHEVSAHQVQHQEPTSQKYGYEVRTSSPAAYPQDTSRHEIASNPSSGYYPAEPSRHEVVSNPGSVSYPYPSEPPFHEISSTPAPRHELLSQPYYPPPSSHPSELTASHPSPSLSTAAIARKPLSPSPEPSASNISSPQPSTRTSIPPWDTTQDHDFSAYQPQHHEIINEERTAEDIEIQRLEEEMAQVKLRKERLQNLQRLEEREEELRRKIEERRGGGPS
ncbi:hypothetical protein B0O99DRAFT_616824 [Bisporella sp. PMI_857]|nr:hypothetical protein B0O99DRAFT_616824 [Bisporella sp. PMI_857]